MLLACQTQHEPRDQTASIVWRSVNRWGSVPGHEDIMVNMLLAPVLSSSGLVRVDVGVHRDNPLGPVTARPDNTLRLYSCGLLPKWGFSEGDLPDELMDYWDITDTPYPEWRPMLCALVYEHLLPALRRNHEITVVEIEALHNPIRATMIDGVSIDDIDFHELVLIPKYVTIPYSIIDETVKRLAQESC